MWQRTTSHIHLEHDIHQHKKKQDLVEEVDKYVSDYIHMITKRASGKDVENDNRPHVGDLVAIVKEDKNVSGFFHSRLRYGIVTAKAKPSSDGLSRSSFIQIRCHQGEVFDQELMEGSTYYTVHRKNKHIMVLESQDAIQSIEQIFREDAIRVEKMVNLVEKDNL
jgi:hypothetical protein